MILGTMTFEEFMKIYAEVSTEDAIKQLSKIYVAEFAISINKQLKPDMQYELTDYFPYSRWCSAEGIDGEGTSFEQLLDTTVVWAADQDGGDVGSVPVYELPWAVDYLLNLWLNHMEEDIERRLKTEAFSKAAGLCRL